MPYTVGLIIDQLGQKDHLTPRKNTCCCICSERNRRRVVFPNARVASIPTPCTRVGWTAGPLWPTRLRCPLDRQLARMIASVCGVDDERVSAKGQNPGGGYVTIAGRKPQAVGTPHIRCLQFFFERTARCYHASFDRPRP